jgi:hypothetical protein
MTSPLGKSHFLILVSILLILISLTSVSVVQFSLSFKETNSFASWVLKVNSDWVAPLAVPISVSGALLGIISGFIIVKDIRNKQHRRGAGKIHAWASDAFKLLVTPSTEESPDLLVGALKTKFQTLKTGGMNALIESERINRDIHDSVRKALSSVLKISEALSKKDAAFDFKGELNTLLKRLDDVKDRTSER